MKQISILIACAFALAIVGCGKKDDAATTTTGTTGTTTTTTTGTPDAPAASGGIEGDYAIKLDDAQQKQIDEGKKQLEDLKAKADKGDAAAKAQYDMAKPMMEEAEKMMSGMSLTIKADGKWSMTMMGQTGEGTYTKDGNKISLAVTKKPDGKPLTAADKEPLVLNWDEAAKTLSGEQGGAKLTFVKK